MKNKHKLRVSSNLIKHCGIVQLTITYIILTILAKTNGEVMNYASVTPELHVDLINIKNTSQQVPVSIDNVNNRKNTIEVNKEERMADFVFSNPIDNKKNTKYNIKVEPIYNFERKKIVFNVTWSKPKDVKILSYKFKLSSNCTYHFFETPIYQKSNLTNIFIPPILNSEEVLPGCDYKITTTIDTYDYQTDIINIYYHVPECVGQKCSCRLLTPKFESFAAYEIQPGTLNITWKIMKNTNRSVHQITNKMFEYRLLNISRKHANPFKKIFSISSNVADNTDYVILNDTRFLVHDKQYELRATFNNSFNCKAYNYTNITVTKFHIIHETEKKSSWTIWVISISLILFLLIAASYFFKRNRLIIKELILNPSSVNIFRRERRELDIRSSYFMVPTIIKRREEINVIYIDKEIIDGNVDRYEFPRSGLNLIKKIGSGAFGEVYLATALDINSLSGYTDAAVKTLNESASPEEMDDFLSEIEILKKIGQHTNIVQLLGCCILKKPYLMIMEYMPCGDLLHYLLNLRETWSRSKNYSSSVFSDISDGAYIVPDSPMCTIQSGDRPSLTETEYTTLETPSPTQLQNNKIECSLSHTELQQFALQIAKGMEHLEKIPITHRDLAARNILIDEYKTLKISDFGLSRFGPYVNNRTQRLPLRWISLEAIKDHFYDSKGDVWSFAVVLWEIGTLGGFPYEGVSNSMVPAYLARGNRLPRPEICTDELYSLMLKCWTYEPEERPSFKELVEMLDVKKTRVYVDFSQLNPLYVFPPSKCNDQKCTLTDSTTSVI